MNEQIIVPVLGESITEATISKWLKNQGEAIKLDEPIVELETDKVNVEVPSPAEGILSEINFKNGDTVEVGALLGTISSEDENVVPITKSKKQEKKRESIKEEKNIISDSEKNLSIFDEKKSKNNNEEIEQPLVLNQQVKEEIEQPLVMNQQVKEEIEQPLVMNQDIFFFFKFN